MDKYLWLEDRNGAQATAWAQTESNLTRTHLEADPRFPQSSREIFDILRDTDKIPYPTKIFQGHAYNFWQDEKHQRGIWRRASLEEYKKSNPAWEVLLDLDALVVAEKEPWVFRGASFQKGSDRVMVALSRNNQDSTEQREFSLSQKRFIKGGFFFPDSKSSLSWYDEDHLLVASALHEETQTSSGYPRKIFLWKRGEDFTKASLIFEGQKDDVSVWAYTIWDGDTKIVVLSRSPDFNSSESFVLSSDLKLNKIPVPLDAWMVGMHKGQFLLSLRSEWKGFESGTVLSFPVSYTGAADVDVADLREVFAPTATSSLADSDGTKNRFYLLVNENVRGRVYEAIFDEASKQWRLQALFPAENSFSLLVSDQDSDTIGFLEEGHLQPIQMWLKEEERLSVVKKSKSYFNESGFLSEQLWAASPDGTKIPYFVVRAKDLKYDGTHATLLYGYGGFMVSNTPHYLGARGKEWLEKGGVFVVANIRGGGEFGPEWHKAAIRENKQKSYDDFIAVAEDLIARKITSPAHLGIQGGSNGGLLVGVVAMQRPDLFSAVICQIPLLDMIRYTQLPPGASWMAEYGDPADPKFFEIISKYSPYQNVSRDKKYPKIYFQTTQADDRVHPGHARKMAAKMKEYGHDVYFFESTDGGHGGGGVKLEDQARVGAYGYVYLYQQLMK